MNVRPANFDDSLSSALLNHELPQSGFGMFTDAEQGAEYSDGTIAPSRLSDHLRFESTLCGHGGMAPACEALSQMTAADSSGTIVPAMLHSGQRNESGRFAPSKNGDQLREEQEIAQKRSLECGKPSHRAKKSRSHPSTRSQGSVSSKRRRMTTSAPDQVEIRNAIAKKLRTHDHELAEDMTNLYLATASSDSLCQLKDVLVATWGTSNWTMGQTSSTIADTLHMLEKLENVQQAACFIRRILLLRLYKLRETFASRFKEYGKHQGHNDDQPDMLIVGKVESNILDCLMEDAYPGIDRRPQDADSIRKWRDKYGTEKKALQNRFQSAKKWNVLSERFSCGVIALVPSGGQFHIQNQKYDIHYSIDRSC